MLINPYRTVLFLLYQSFFSRAMLLQYKEQTIILLSFDGFRYDYINKYNLLNIQRIAYGGIIADSLEPSFVTKTFPNHFTIVTGLYEESHGIVANYMYDPVYKQYFDPLKSSSDPKWWNSTTPIWIENENSEKHDINKVRKKNNSKKYKSASIYWPGSETTYNNKNIYFTKTKYDPNYTFEKRFDKIIELLLEPDPVNFVACYFEEPDKTGHQYGPESKQMKKQLLSLDEKLGFFLSKLERANLYDKVNIIAVSDHGMSTIQPKNVYTLTDYTNPDNYDLIDYGTFLFLNPKPGKRETVYKNLKKIPHLATYYKEDIPEKYHYKHNRRVSDIFSLAEEGYFISPNQNFTKNKSRSFGDHGYNNGLKNMHGIFLAHGPAFKTNMKIKPVKNIDIYNLLCYILDLKAHPNNGSLERIQSILREKTLFTVIMKNPALIITLLSVCALFVVAVILGCTVSCYRNLKDTAKSYTCLNDQEVPLTKWESESFEEDLRPMR